MIANFYFSRLSYCFEKTQIFLSFATCEKIVIATKIFDVVFLCAAPPKMRMVDKYRDGMVINAGTSAVLEVPFSGCPQPMADWKWNSRSLPDPRRFDVDTIRNMTTLRMSKVKMSDAGEFSLSLSNKNGSANLKVIVTVLGKCGF